ncbi:MAG: glycoside hydrolase family 9 protein, partial [Tannerella sp.]|nr:glycoside hydrolase family 9 protein [Tannerella sp.]
MIIRKLLLLLFLNYFFVQISLGEGWLRINQLGYLPNSVKVAVYISDKETDNPVFTVKDAKSNVSVFSGKGLKTNAKRWAMQTAMRLNFSEIDKNGEYYLECNGVKSPVFQINNGVYDGTADFLLQYMRQQRCGYNPYLDTVCHQHDGYIVYQPGHAGEKIDVRGGWHDASDCLQYLPTSANATFQMLFAWQQTPDKTVFKDEHTAAGKKGSNGIPDILDEIKWGLEWMARMNPDSAVMFNQIADDRDHAGMRLPQYDSVDYGYGKGLGRPVYFITGEPQGLGKYKNRSTGVSSSAGKFASAFALGAETFKNIDPEFALTLSKKAASAYRFGEAIPGNFQTACTVSPYFYEEDNWVDDMELAAAALFDVSGDLLWLKKADYWGVLEEVTPWMELYRARHYQFYPFVNIGHYYLAQQTQNKEISAKYKDFMKKGLEMMLNRAKDFNDPFLNGAPFIWCSNNLVAAAITQARLYNEVSGDDAYLEMEAALRDWLFGCNPWGTSMICGLPAHGDSPERVHSFVVEINQDNTFGGLVDGPVYRKIYENLLGISLKYEDPYIPFNNGEAVYHDDPGDYSTNEPTMDGTASLTFYLSNMQKLGKGKKKVIDNQGATIKIESDRKIVHLIFSADTQFEGADAILRTLDKNGVKASFFLTGNCLRMKEFENIIKR